MTLWDLKFEVDFKPTERQKYNTAYPGYVIDCTQMFFLRSIQKCDPSIQLDSLLDIKNKKVKQSEICLANNLVIASHEEVGLGLCSKFLGKPVFLEQKGVVLITNIWNGNNCTKNIVILRMN